MSRLSRKFEALFEKREGAYIPYVCAGDLGNGFTLDLIRGLSSAGADVIELGLPFSDPVADGPTIQGAMKRSLDSGFKVADVFDIIRQTRSFGIDQPIVLMTYHNPVNRMGVSEFCKRLADAGGDGILVVDLPPEESGELDTAAERNSLDVIRLIAPSTPDERVRMILSRASGFVYAVSVAGVTGQRQGLPETALPLVKRISSQTRLPVALGFGISRPEHARAAYSSGAAGAVEGSGLISLYLPLSEDTRAAVDAVRSHAFAMKRAMRPE